jgi:hypothetical protein
MHRPDWSTIRGMHGVQDSWLWKWGLVGQAKAFKVRLENGEVLIDLTNKGRGFPIRAVTIAYQRGPEQRKRPGCDVGIR